MSNTTHFLIRLESNAVVEAQPVCADADGHWTRTGAAKMIGWEYSCDEVTGIKTKFGVTVEAQDARNGVYRIV